MEMVKNPALETVLQKILGDIRKQEPYKSKALSVHYFDSPPVDTGYSHECTHIGIVEEVQTERRYLGIFRRSAVEKRPVLKVFQMLNPRMLHADVVDKNAFGIVENHLRGYAAAENLMIDWVHNPRLLSLSVDRDVLNP